MSDAIHAKRLAKHHRLAGRDFFSSLASEFGGGGFGDPAKPTTPATSSSATPSSTSDTHTTAAPTSKAETTKSSSSTVKTTSATTTSSSSSTSSASSTSSTESSSSSSTESKSSSTTAKSSSTQSSTQSSSSTSSSSSSASSSSSSVTPSATPSSALTLATPPPTAATTQFLTTPIGLDTPSSIVTLSSTVTFAGAAASSASSSSSSVSTGAVVGGIAAGVVGVAGILFAILYFWRRSHKHDDEVDFNADTFRRQSIILPDEGMLSRSSSINRGNNDEKYNARPPSMTMENNMAGTGAGAPVSYNPQPMHQGYSAPGGYYNQYAAPPQYAAPQQYGQMPLAPAPAHTANPFAAPYGQVPVGAVVDARQYDYGYHGQNPAQPVQRQPSNGAAQYLNQQQTQPQPPSPVHQNLTRQPSAGPVQSLYRQPSAGPAQGLQRQPSDIATSSLYSQPSDLVAQLLNRPPSTGANQLLSRQPAPGNPTSAAASDAHYVDLDRSSVTPFQAAQYSEISRQLNVQAPQSAAPPTPEINVMTEKSGMLAPMSEPVSPAPPYAKDDQPPPSPSPSGPFSDRAEVKVDGAEHLDAPEDEHSKRDSFPLPLPNFDDQPRVGSTPPILPEIQHYRAFSPMAAEYPAASMSRSPQNASFNMLSPPPTARTARFSQGPAVVPASLLAAGRPLADSGTEAGVRVPETAYTVHDNEDAYSGI
ncbi:hypothetical protein WOLCODRAFT_140418 [Wolfiporia cocos MD-104 SS10]|uniref:REJ domain-containing protein n=1 Tax=Wolfiporia cocos (strain MD-104) TaxID=742152 RepID=A0A2H3J2F9_WOLCO|nr:hypothetical protein WOLCODRAFT_140418 [Wolfiporia cocos MD-104 SS10]